VLPGRTDNEIKNYWNTHLKKKLTKQHAMGAILALPWCSSVTGNRNIDHHEMISKSKVDQAYGAGASPAYSNKEVPQLIVQGRPSPFADTTSDIWSSSSYAFSLDNISKLLHGFMESSALPPLQNYSDGNDMKDRVNPLSSFDRTSDTGSSFTASVQQPATTPSSSSIRSNYVRSSSGFSMRLRSWSCPMNATPFLCCSKL
jgi:myb proto-oncogene protein